MATMIIDECISCGACEPECPNNAIFESGANWNYAGKEHGANDPSPSGLTGFHSEDRYYIVPDKCTECVGFNDEPACAAVCPTESCVPNPDIKETKEQLLAKKEKLDEVGR